jgi:hypothetical protein
LGEPVAVEQPPATRSQAIPGVRVTAGRAALGPIAAARGAPLALRAFLASRLLVFLAGFAGVLLVRPQAGWRPFDLGGVASHLGSVENLLVGFSVRGDALHYLAIASHGYAATTARSPVFFPLYPLLIRIGGFLMGSEVLAGVAISLASFAAALLLLGRLTELELGPSTARATVLLLAFAPLAFFFSAVYTESLFLLFSVGALLAARRERWALAAVLTSLATLTRVTGILLIAPIVIMQMRRRRRVDARLAWTLLPIASLGAYLAYLAATGLGWLAPFTDERLWGRVSAGPLAGVVFAVKDALQAAGAITRGAVAVYQPTRFGPLTPSAESILLVFVLGIACAALLACFRRLPFEYGVYAGVALVTCISSPDSGQPLFSLDRYVLTIFPLWMAAGSWIAGSRRARYLTLAAGALLLAFYTVHFSSWEGIA